MKIAFFLLGFILIAIPIAFSFTKKLNFYTNIKYLIPSLTLTVIVFGTWSALFTEIGIWSFDSQYHLGATVFGVPFEELFLVAAYAYSSIFMYELLNLYFPKKYKIPNLFYILFIGFLFCIFSYYEFIDLLYSGYVLLIGAMVLITHLVGYKKYTYLGKFYRAFLVLLIPLTLVEVLITSNGIKTYSDLEKTNKYFATMPRENMLYLFIMLSMSFAIYEALKKRAKRKAKKKVA